MIKKYRKKDISFRRKQITNDKQLQTVKNYNDKKIPKERYIYIYPEERQKLIDNLRSIIIL